MTMKHLLYILTSFFLIAGCGPENPEKTEAVKLSVDKTSLEFTADGGDDTFTVTSSGQLYIVPGDGWVKTRKGAANANSTV